jgi:nicotinamidase-related amidase/catechol 2,3-dioxygenase-like lactoylglutathione lyase family enzyme
MQTLKLAWLGTRTAAYGETLAFFRDVLGLTVVHEETDFGVLGLRDGATVEVFGPRTEHNRHLTSPVAGFLVDDIEAAAAELAAAGAEIVLPLQRAGERGWLHFRAPDGHLYELTRAPEQLPRGGLVDRADSLLVVVDAQPGFVAAEPAAAAAVERIAWMAGMARLLGIPAVAVEEGPDREGPTEPRILAALPEGTPVIAKPTFGLAGCTEAVAAIEATGRRTAVLVGFETDVCMMQSAVGLQELGYRAVVLADAAYTSSAREHERGLARMGEAGVERNHCKGLVFEWLRHVDEAIEVFTAAEALGTPPWRL